MVGHASRSLKTADRNRGRKAGKFVCLILRMTCIVSIRSKKVVRVEVPEHRWCHVADAQTK